RTIAEHVPASKGFQVHGLSSQRVKSTLTSSFFSSGSSQPQQFQVALSDRFAISIPSTVSSILGSTHEYGRPPGNILFAGSTSGACFQNAHPFGGAKFWPAGIGMKYNLPLTS